MTATSYPENPGVQQVTAGAGFDEPSLRMYSRSDAPAGSVMVAAITPRRAMRKRQTARRAVEPTNRRRRLCQRPAPAHDMLRVCPERAPLVIGG